MNTPTEQMNTAVQRYFKAWRDRDGDLVAKLFTADGAYIVKPFGLEEYHGRDQIRQYWDDNAGNPNRSQPNPEVLNIAYGVNICFIEWKNRFVASNGTPVTTLGMMILEFQDGLIKELREHFLTAADPAPQYP